MGYYTKVKKDFSFRKIKFKGIECYEGDEKAIRVTVTGTAQMIRQILKSQYPKYIGEGTWVKTRKFANGDAIDVYLNRFPEDVYKAVKADLDVFDSYAVNHRNAERVEIKTDDGMIIDANTKYLSVDNVPPYGSKEKNEEAPDWEKILKGSTKQKTTTTNDNSKFSKGEMLRECAGWEIYKKTLPDGRIVYSAFKNKQTKPNKEDWNTIKSEVYLQSGFKYGRFGNFEKWGSMTANDENLILNALCEVLTKYYGSATPTTPQPTTDEAINVYIDGEFTQEVANEQEAFVFLNNNFGVDKFSEMSVKRQVFNDREAKKVWVFRHSFYYGEQWGVSKENGNLLQLYLAEKGFKVFIGAGTNNNSLVIYKTDFGDDKIIISDFNGDFNLNVYGDYKKFAGSVNYVIDNNPISPETLAGLISNMYDNYFPNSKQDEPTPTDKEKLTKAIAGLEILAAKGNEKAQKAIIGLKYILNK